jgi:hypothetical protein
VTFATQRLRAGSPTVVGTAWCTVRPRRQSSQDRSICQSASFFTLRKCILFRGCSLFRWRRCRWFTFYDGRRIRRIKSFTTFVVEALKPTFLGYGRGLPVRAHEMMRNPRSYARLEMAAPKNSYTICIPYIYANCIGLEFQTTCSHEMMRQTTCSHEMMRQTTCSHEMMRPPSTKPRVMMR